MQNKLRTIEPEAPRCYGVGCGLHATCQRYASVDRAPHEARFIGTCDRGDGKWVGFVAMKVAA